MSEMLHIVSSVLLVIGHVFIVISALAFFKAKDSASAVKVVMACMFYVVPLVLIGMLIDNFSLIATFKMMLIVGLMFLITHLVCHKLSE